MQMVFFISLNIIYNKKSPKGRFFWSQDDLGIEPDI